MLLAPEGSKGGAAFAGAREDRVRSSERLVFCCRRLTVEEDSDGGGLHFCGLGWKYTNLTKTDLMNVVRNVNSYQTNRINDVQTKEYCVRCR